MSKTRRRRKNAVPYDQLQIRERHSRKGRAPTVDATSEPGKTEPPIVSDHALVRWLERITGIDIRASVEPQILAHGRDDLIKRMGQGKIRLLEHDAQLVIRGGRVVTVEPADR